MTNVPGWLPNLLGKVVQADGVPVTARAAVNFIGFDVTDNPTDDSTDIEHTGGGGGSTPTGTGFRHVTSNTEDGTAEKVDLTSSADVTVPGTANGVVTSSGTVLQQAANVLAGSGYISIGSAPATAGVFRLVGDASNAAPQIVARDNGSSLNRTVIHATETLVSLGCNYDCSAAFNTVQAFATTAVGLGIGSTTELYIQSGSVNIYNPSSHLTFGYTGAASVGTIRLKNADTIYALRGDGLVDIQILSVGANLILGDPDQTLNIYKSYAGHYFRIGANDTITVTAANLLVAKPVVGDTGYSSPYSVHGGVVHSFAADADYTVTAAQYSFDWLEFTTGSWSAGHTVSFPQPASKALGYYKTIHNNTSKTITLATDPGGLGTTTRTLTTGLAQRFWFDDAGVKFAGPTFTP